MIVIIVTNSERTCVDNLSYPNKYTLEKAKNDTSPTTVRIDSWELWERGKWAGRRIERWGLHSYRNNELAQVPSPNAQPNINQVVAASDGVEGDTLDA